jgi:hypothetical protein
MQNFKNKSICLIIALLTNVLYAQQFQIKGLVSDFDNSPIQYAKVGLINSPTGTVTNLSGKFELLIKNTEVSDTLKISAFGFYDKIIPVKKLLNQSNISIILDYSPIELEEVIVSGKNFKTYTEGQTRSKTKKELFFVMPGMDNINLGAEIGGKFSLGKKQTKLEEFSFYLKQNNFDNVSFKVNIYSIGKKNIPQDRLNEEDIVKTINSSRTGWIDVDLSPYYININQDIVICIEWVDASEKGDTLSLPIFAPTPFQSTYYYKQSSQSKWRKYGIISTSMKLKYKQ